MATYLVDKDRAIGYETNSIRREILNALLIPVLNSLPTGIKPYLRKSDRSGQEIIDNATTHKALEVLYKYSDVSKSKTKMLSRFFRSVWLNTNNSKAVRNRLRLVKRELINEIDFLIRSGKSNVKILSIAAGSAHAVIESTGIFRNKEKASIQVTFVDKNPEAIAYSKKISDNHPHQHNFKWVQATATEFFKQTQGEKFDIVEIVGLIDYFDDEKATRMFSRIYDALNEWGLLITANIDDNRERPFITKAVGWPMIYRGHVALSQLLQISGFGRQKMNILYEPQQIHCVIMARK